MFRNELKEKFEKIFGFAKTTFNEPSESFEQDTLFVELAEVTSRVTEGKAYAKVQGSLAVFSQMDKLPFGFFNKRIQNADPALTKDLFFFDMDVNAANSPARMQNISERRARFVFLYSAQYDPIQGQITELREPEGE